MSALVGDVIELEITKVANGGFCIGRHEGQVVFVRHTAPGETVRAEITEINKKFLRADTVEVMHAHPQRVAPVCQYAGLCGGCDWQHLELSAQRDLKSQIVREQLSHLGKVTDIAGKSLDDFHVEAMPGDDTGLHWRTRNRFTAIADMGVGLFMSRSHSVVEIDDCLIAEAGAVELAHQALGFTDGDIQTVLTATGNHVVVDPRNGPMIDEKVLDRTWHIHAGSFWQVHKRAPETFVRAVRDFASLNSGESLLDLYSGAGLFAASLAQDVGEDGHVVAVESSIDAVRDARRSCSDLPQLDLVTSDVSKWVNAHQNEKFDVVVLDPPRSGAGMANVALVAAMAKRAIVYVACEPSALGRDTAVLRQAGWQLTGLRGFDAFPMTSHVECIALFEPAKVS